MSLGASLVASLGASSRRSAAPRAAEDPAPLGGPWSLSVRYSRSNSLRPVKTVVYVCVWGGGRLQITCWWGRNAKNLKETENIETWDIHVRAPRRV